MLETHSTGLFVTIDEFQAGDVNGLSQWSDSHPVIMLNLASCTDRPRLTLPHELGHLCLHSHGVPDDVAADTSAFAAEFLMSADTIRPQLRNLITGKLHDLERHWGVSMQALVERAYRLKPSQRVLGGTTLMVVIPIDRAGLSFAPRSSRNTHADGFIGA